MATEADCFHNAEWVFECINCKKRWYDPDAPVNSHYCNWHGRGIPSEDEPEYDVIVIKKP